MAYITRVANFHYNVPHGLCHLTIFDNHLQPRINERVRVHIMHVYTVSLICYDNERIDTPVKTHEVAQSGTHRFYPCMGGTISEISEYVCVIGYPSETHLQLKSGEISFIHNINAS